MKTWYHKNALLLPSFDIQTQDFVHAVQEVYQLSLSPVFYLFIYLFVYWNFVTRFLFCKTQLKDCFEFQMKL